MGNSLKLTAFGGMKTSVEGGRTLIDKVWNKGTPRFEGAMEFDGVDEKIMIGEDGLGEDLTELSISTWLKNGTIPGEYSYAIHRGEGNNIGTSVYWVGVNNNGRIAVAINGQFGPGDTGVTEPVNEWYHVSAVWDGAQVRVYVNGVLEKTYSLSSISNDTSGGRLAFGNSMDSQNSRWYPGLMSEVQIYNRALTQQEIKNNMNKRFRGMEDGLVAYYPLDEIVDINGSPYVLDKTPNNNHGAVNGSPTVDSPFNPEWVGDDRPELHKTLDGHYQLAVEKGSTNIISGNVVFEDDMPAPLEEAEHYGVKSRVAGAGGVVATSDFTVSGLDPFKTYTASTHLYLSEGYDRTNWSIRSIYESNVVASQVADMSIREEWQYLELTITGVDTIVFRTGGNYTTSDLRWLTLSKVEEGSYATNWHPTGSTRLAPAPVIENALPGTGTVAGVANAVNQNGDRTTFWRAGDGPGDTSWLIFENNSNLRWGNFGGLTTENNNIGWIWPNNERDYVSWINTYDSTAQVLWILHGSNIYKYSGSTGNDTDNRDVSIGQKSSSSNPHSSVRFEVPWYKDEIVRVNATDSEIKAFFEELTRGTSMEMKAHQMTIV